MMGGPGAERGRIRLLQSIPDACGVPLAGTPALGCPAARRSWKGKGRIFLTPTHAMYNGGQTPRIGAGWIKFEGNFEEIGRGPAQLLFTSRR